MTLVLSFASAKAQTYLITATGTFEGGSGIYSSVPAGTTYVMKETFNVATATLTVSSTTNPTYTDPTGTSSLVFDGYTVSGTAPEIEIVSDDVVGGQALYGFEFSQTLPSGSYAVQLLSANAADAPSTSLSSLNNLQTAAFSDFENHANLNGYQATDGTVGGGVTTSLSVQLEAVPEPSSTALFALATLLFIGLRTAKAFRREPPLNRNTDT